MDFVEVFSTYISLLVLKLTSSQSSYFIIYLGIAMMLYFFIYVSRKRNKSNFKIHGLELLKSKSFYIDMLFFLIIPFVAFLDQKIWAFFTYYSHGVAYKIQYLWKQDNYIENNIILTIIWGNLSFVFSDFWYYLSHRCFHTSKIHWCFHSVHHSLSSLSITSGFRMHPGESLLKTIWDSIGLVIIYLFFNLINVNSVKLTLVTVSALFIIQKIRSWLVHTWFCFPRWLSYIVMSPAMHVVHHSKKPHHIGKNIGRFFSIWDYLFGTLYIPAANEVLDLGIDPNDSMFVDDASLSEQLLKPLINCFGLLFAYYKKIVSVFIFLKSELKINLVRSIK